MLMKIRDSISDQVCHDTSDMTCVRSRVIDRLWEITIGLRPALAFGELCKTLDVDDRQLIRKGLNSCLPGLWQRISGILSDRRFGSVIVNWPWIKGVEAQTILAFAKSLGEVLPETRRTCGGEMSPENYVSIKLTSGINSEKRRRHFSDPTLAWPLHTDRTLHEDAGDFLVVAKTRETATERGGIRLLHVDDFSRLDEFTGHPLALVPLEWRGDIQLAPLHERISLRLRGGVMAPVFEYADGWQIRFTDDRFRHPASPEQGSFLRDLDSALAEKAEQLPAYNMPVGSFYIINNRFWLHGREGFPVNTGKPFEREVLRICGNLRR